MKKIISILFLLAFAASAMAQQNCYQQTTLVRLISAAALTQSSSNTLATTNATVDIHGFQGIGAFVLTVVSNSADSAIAPQLITTIQDSADGTNFTTLATIAASTISTLTITNVGGKIATNSYFTPGTSFTGSAVITNTASGLGEYGILLSDSRRYLRAITSLSGTNAVYGVSGTIRGLRSTPWP